MAFGGSNSGKSYDYYNIALRSQKSGSDAKFYIIDTDVSVGRMLDDPAFADLVLPDDQWDDVDDWAELTASIKRFGAVMRPQDWLMIDMLSPTWQMCQDHFTHSVWDKSLEDYFLQKRASMKNPEKEQAFAGWTDWPVINSMYGAFQNSLLRCPGNLYVTSEVKALNRDQAEKDTKALFGPFGVVPVGQKRNPHLFQTILWHQELRPDHRVLTTVKDRSRQKVQGVEVKDFAIGYLVKVAGWKLS